MRCPVQGWRERKSSPGTVENRLGGGGVPQMLKGVAIWPSNSSPGIQPRETRRYIHKTSQEVQAIQVPIMHKCACKMRSTCKTECYWAVKRDETRTIRS